MYLAMRWKYSAVLGRPGQDNRCIFAAASSHNPEEAPISPAFCGGTAAQQCESILLLLCSKLSLTARMTSRKNWRRRFTVGVRCDERKARTTVRGSVYRYIASHGGWRELRRSLCMQVDRGGTLHDAIAQDGKLVTVTWRMGLRPCMAPSEVPSLRILSKIKDTASKGEMLHQTQRPWNWARIPKGC
jgi:hypothetical protein